MRVCTCITMRTQLWIWRLQKYASNQKSFKQKLFGIEFHTKKSANAYVYLPQSGPTGSKDWYGWNIILYLNGKIHSIQGSTSPKIYIKSKLWTHVYLLQREARGLERLIRLKYYFVLKWQNTFISGLNAAKTTHQIKKALRVVLNWILYKKVHGHICLSPPPEWS